MAQSYECPDCGIALRAYDNSWNFSLVTWLLVFLAGWPVFAVVLLLFPDVNGAAVSVATVAASALSLLVAWRIARLRAADHFERFACPRCLRVFPARELQTKLTRGGTRAP